MKVRFAPDALADPASWRAINQIVDRFLYDDERHLWDTDDPGAIEESPWITGDPGSRATRRHLEALEMIPMRALYPSAAHAHTLLILVSVVEALPETLSPADALRLLETPVYVVLEDAESDSAFLHAMISAFGRSLLRDGFHKGWWVVQHGGGSGVPKRVAELVARAPKGPRRILVLSDSDRWKRDDPSKPGEKPEKLRIMEKCRDDHDVKIAILNKREMENYLSPRALARDPDRLPRDEQRRYRAFLALTQEQRDYYDMKVGFTKDERGDAAIRPEHGSLFQHVPSQIRRDLCGGFGKNIWMRFKETAYIKADDVRLICPDDPGEIERILDAIERLL